MNKVLRASKAGFPCERNLWYSVNGYQEVVSARSQRIFDVGTALEPVIVEWLKADGWNVEYNPGSQNAALEVTVPIAGGFLAGHPDCIISKGDIQNALVDIKTMNDRAFTYWRRSGSLKAKPQYVTQLHIYAMGLRNMGRDIEKLGIVGVNKNNSEMYIDFFDFDMLIEAEITNNAEMLFRENEPPDFNCPAENWACEYCEFHDVCKPNNEALPTLEDKDIPNEVPITTDETIINAMKTLKDARQLSKKAKELEKGAKTELDENVKDKGLRSIQGGGLYFYLTEKASSDLDTKALKAAYPGIAQQFTKQSISTVYNIKTLKEDKNADM